jgi:hypothetical protein
LASSSCRHLRQNVCKHGRTLGSTKSLLHMGHLNLESSRTKLQMLLALGLVGVGFLEVCGVDLERSWLICVGSIDLLLAAPTSWLCRRLAKLPKMYDILSISIIICTEMEQHDPSRIARDGREERANGSIQIKFTLIKPKVLQLQNLFLLATFTTS